MNKVKTLILLSLCLAAYACGNSEGGQAIDVSDDTVDMFVPSPGMKLSQLVDLPGVTWSFDTIHGVCTPDTLLLWMGYDDHYYATNVLGTGDSFEMLTSNGLKKAAKAKGPLRLARNDFTPYAEISGMQHISRDEFRELIDSLYAKRLTALTDAARNFFLSGGETQYMTRQMANHWQLIYNQSELVDDDVANPFNGGPAFEFETESIIVQVADPEEGVVEVSAFCWAPYTVGRPGWAYWTVRMTRERGRYVVREVPAQHRRFTN